VVRPLTDRGAASASSAEDVASRAEVVFISLPTPPIVQSVSLGDKGILNGSRVKTMIDLSTTGPSVAKVVARAAGERGVAWADSPVSGGVTGAAKGTLAVMVSCAKPTFEEIDPLLQVFGKTFYVGDKPGLAQIAKLANNLLAAAALVVSSEVVAMGVKAGLDAKVLIDIINAGSGRNSATQDKFPRSILPRTFDFGFATGLSYKDVRLCVEEAESLGVPMVAGAAVRQMLAITQAKYGPDSDFTMIAKVVEEWAGVEMKG
jgi:3-hydroxyisobutyrate dehydrogenase-like beta-hydroxyacid dehydrogenase